MNNINFELLRKQREQLLFSIFEDENNVLWTLVDELDKVIELENG